MAGDASTPGYLNGDGFGLGWYSLDPSDYLPCVYRQARPAWNDSNLSMIAEKVHSGVLFAHVRAASPGMDVSETTCHPFRFGRYLWMHNGQLGGFRAVRRIILPLLNEEAFDFAITNGSSDSALCFAVFLNLVSNKTKRSSPDEMRLRLDKTLQILTDAVREAGVTEVSLLNFVVSCGETLVASRFVLDPQNPDAKAASLYHASGNDYIADPKSPRDYYMVHIDRRPTLAIVSSEPLTEDRGDWTAVPKNHIVLVTSSLHVLLFPVGHSSVNISRTLSSLADQSNSTPLWPSLSSDLSAPGSSSDDSAILAKAVLSLRTPDSAPRAGGLRRNRSVLQRAVRSRALGSRADGASKVFPTRPQSAVTSPGPQASSTRYTIQTEDQATLALVVAENYLCVGAQDGTIRVWEIRERQDFAVLDCHTGAILALAYDKNAAALVSASSDSTIRVWSMRSEEKFACLSVMTCDESGDVFALAILNRFLFAGFSDTRVRKTDRTLDAIVAEGRDRLAQRDDAQRVRVQTCPSASMSCLFDGEISQVNEDALLRPKTSGLGRRSSVLQTLRDNGPSVVDSSSPELQLEIPKRQRHLGFVFALQACRGDALLCTGCGDGVVRVWDAESGEWLRSLDGHSGAVLALAASESDQSSLLVSGSRDMTVKVWDIDQGFVCRRTIRRHKAEVISCASSGDVFLTASADGHAYMWCIQSLQCLACYSVQSIQCAAVGVPHGLVFLATDRCEILAHDLVSSSSKPPGNPTSPGQTKTRVSSKNTTLDRILPSPPLLDTAHTLHLLPNANSALNGERNVAAKAVLNGLEKTNGAGSERTGGDEDAADGEIVPGIPDEVVLASPPLLPKPSVEDGLCKATVQSLSLLVGGESGLTADEFDDRVLQDVLTRFVSFATVSGSDRHKESCWQGARYVANLMESMGAKVAMISPSSSSESSTTSYGSHGPPRPAKLPEILDETHRNPVVLAEFASPNPHAPRLTFYGHYDVMPAAEESDWRTDPWTLTAIDGYLYGRGATDNKGPILAMIFALKSLLGDKSKPLAINVTVVLEGEGERGNVGFRETVNSNLHWFANTSLILTSNSFWLGEDHPCITYGMRGVVNLTVSVIGGVRNLHAGVDGGTVFEPMLDLLAVLSTLQDAQGHIMVPGFYDKVRPLTEYERRRLEDVDFEIDQYSSSIGVTSLTTPNALDLLERRWRQPSISISAVESSNETQQHTVIPHRVSAKVSVRIVPDQAPRDVEQAMRNHLTSEFQKRRSPNELEVKCTGHGDWWLCDPSSDAMQIADQAIREVWGTEPQYVCEGGTMPMFSFLSNTLAAPLVHVPLGQSSDGAHLPNERIRAKNLFRGKQVLQHIVSSMSDAHRSSTS